MVFFEKKNQKTFDSLAAVCPGSAGPGPQAFLASFV
jgi:hypothetical protein